MKTTKLKDRSNTLMVFKDLTVCGTPRYFPPRLYNGKMVKQCLVVKAISPDPIPGQLPSTFRLWGSRVDEARKNGLDCGDKFTAIARSVLYKARVWTKLGKQVFNEDGSPVTVEKVSFSVKTAIYNKKEAYS